MHRKVCLELVLCLVAKEMSNDDKDSDDYDNDNDNNNDERSWCDSLLALKIPAFFLAAVVSAFIGKNTTTTTTTLSIIRLWWLCNISRSNTLWLH